MVKNNHGKLIMDQNEPKKKTRPTKNDRKISYYNATRGITITSWYNLHYSKQWKQSEIIVISQKGKDIKLPETIGL